MTRHRTFATGDIYPAGYINAMGDLLGQYAAANFRITPVSTTALQIVADATANGTVAIAINADIRFISAPISATAPASGAGTYNIWVTSHVNNFSQEDAATFSYGFGLKLGTAPSGSGEEAISRVVGSYAWDGSQITAVAVNVGPQSAPGQVVIGGALPYTGVGDPLEPGFLLADGRLVVIATYPLFFGRTGHAYNGGVDPGGGMVRLPDWRGRVPVGPDNMGTAQGAAGRLTANAARGNSGGEEKHAMAGAEVGPHTHSGSTGQEPESLDHSHFMPAWIPGSSVVAGWTAVQFGIGTGSADGAGILGLGNEIHSVNQTTGASGMSKHHHDFTSNTGDSVTGAAHNNMQPNQIANWLVRVA